MNCRVERNIDGAPVSVKQGEYQDLKNRAQFSDIEFISALAKVAEDDISELGSGDFGTAYSLGDGRVAKLTSSRDEAEVSLRQMQIQAEGAVKIHEVYRDGRSYVIIQEEVDTDSSIEDDFGLLLNLLDSQNLPIQYLNHLDYDELSEEDKSDYDSIEDFIQGIENVNWAYRQLGVEASDIKYDNLGYNEQGELVAFDLDDRRRDRNTPFEGDIKTAMEVIHENEFRNTSSEMSSIEAEKFHINERAKKYGTYLKAPNGAETNLSPEQWVETRTTAFKEWFGDWELDPDNASKVVDENGEPLILYHGTPETRFDTFDRKKGTQRDSGLKEFGNWFTTNKEVAKAYQGEGGIIYSVYLNLKSMPEFNVRGKNYYDGRWDIKADLGYKYAKGAEAIEAMAGKNRMAPDAQVDGLKVKSVIDLEGTIDTKYMGDSYLVMDDTIDGIKIIDVEGESSKVQDIKSKIALGETTEVKTTETLNRLLTKKEIKKLVGRLKETGLASKVIIDTQKMSDYLKTIYGEDFIIEDQLENESKIEIRQLKTKKGENFGFVTPNGDIYLDPTVLTAEVPIHEFTHLWNQYIYETRPELWEDIIEVTKQTVMWDKVANSTQYKEQFKGKEGQDLTDAIADEVWAQIVGIQGQQVWESILDGVEGNRTVLQQILEVLQEYWESVLEVFNYSTEDIVNEREGVPIGKREQSVFSDMERIDNLDKYVDITLREMLSGKPIDTTPTQTTSETIETWGDNISDTVLSKMYESGEIQMTNEEGIICAENGVTSSLTQGGTWSVVKHFKGNSHAQGGIDIVVTDGKVKMTNKQGEFKAKDGVQLPKFSLRQVVGRIKNIGKPDYSDMDRGEAFHQARQDLGTGKTFVHKGTRYSTTTADEQNKDVRSTFKTGAIPTTKIAQVIKETSGQKNTNEPMDIDLSEGTLAYSTTGENVGGNLILGGDYVEKEPTALPAYEYKNRKDKIVLNSQKKDYIENDPATQRFYGIVDGKLKTGLAKDFKDYDVIVPVRWGGKYDQLDEQGEYEHMFYRDGEPVYSSGDKGKVLLHSPSSGQTRFLYYNEAGDVRKKSQEFLKANPDAEYISMDTGRFNYLVGGEDIELDEKHYKYFYNSDFDRGHGKGYNLVYTYPKK